MRKTLSGFTIVELLIVIVIIAILAAISVVAFNGVQQRARASAASTGVSQSKKKLEYYKVDNGSYPTTGNLSSAGVTDGDTTYQYTSDGTTFCITGTNGTVSYKASDTTAPSSGGCAGHGQGGQAAVTNLVVNPGVETNTTGWVSNWGTGGAGTTTRVTTGGQCGSAFHRMTWSTAPTSTWGGHDNANIAVNVGSTYTASLWVRSSIALQIRLSLRPNTYPSPGDFQGSSTSVPANTWTRLSVTSSAIPSGMTTVRPFTARQGAGSWQPGDVLDQDCLMVTEGSSLYNYADGNSTNWVWNGTVNNSTSTGPAL